MNKVTWKITEDEYMGGLDYPSETHERNAMELLQRVNRIRNLYMKPLIVTSGFRTPLHNADIGGAPNSAHCTCRAIDLRDKNGEFCNWLLNNSVYLAQFGLYMENPMYTKGWVHLDIIQRRTHFFLP